MRRRPFLRAAAAGMMTAAGRSIAASVGSNDRFPAVRGRVASIAAGPGSDLAAALRRGLGALLSREPADAWPAILAPSDRPAVKLNCLAAPRLSSDPELADAIASGAVSAGIVPDSIVLFERTTRELERAGYTKQRDRGRVRCFGTDALRGGGYGDQILEHRSIGSLFSRILLDHATALINVGVCKDHDLAGVSAGMKNLYGLIHNPNRYHADACDPFVADLADHPAIRIRLRLTIVDARIAQCHGGPAFNPAYTFSPGLILLATDPVAVERVAWDLIEEERRRRGLPTLEEEKRAPRWIASAAALGLGEADPARIEIIEVAA